MWRDEVLPRLERARASGPTSRSGPTGWPGIGESQVADRLGETLLRRPTRSSRPTPGSRRSTSGSRRSGDGTRERRGPRRGGRARPCSGGVGDFVWATGETTWSSAIGERLDELGWTLAIVEIGTAGQLAELLGDVPWLRFSESIARRRARRARPRRRGRSRRPRRTMTPDRPSGPTCSSGTRPGAGARRRRGRPRPARPAAPRRHGGRRSSSSRPTGVHRRAAAGLPRRRQRSEPGRPGGGRDPPRGAASDRLAVATPCARARRDRVDDDRVALEAQESVVGELPEQLVHALAGAADHRGQVALGQRRPQADRAIGQRRARRRSRAGPGTRPAGR